jgi:hypothetical protein
VDYYYAPAGKHYCHYCADDDDHSNQACENIPGCPYLFFNERIGFETYYKGILQKKHQSDELALFTT